jgi:LacI family transcriptional regulator
MDQVSMDTTATVAKIVRHLHEVGHRKFALISGAPSAGYHSRMEEGFLSALRECEVRKPHIILRDKRQSLSGQLHNVLKSNNRPTAVIAGTPVTAQIAYNAALASGLKVPHDLSLISLLDNPNLEFYSPAIAATTANGREIVALATERLLERIHNPGLAPRHVLLPGEIIPRDTIASP